MLCSSYQYHLYSFVFFFNASASTEIYTYLHTLALHDALPISLNGLVVADADVLGEVGKGLRYAQVRLAPARLTHCMRWTGAAQRAHEDRKSTRLNSSH